MAYLIEFNKDLCRGCGACTICDNWEYSDEGKAYPVSTEITEIGCNQRAADICPVDAIKIVQVVN